MPSGVSAMEKRALGTTGLWLSRLCFGTLTLSPLQKNLPPEKGAELLLYAFERGVNVLDTAELYDNYPAIALALKRWQGEPIYVSTKCYAYDRATAQKSFDLARKKLDRDVIDIFMLHEQESEHTLRGHAEALDFFAEQREKGTIRAVGMSTHFVAGVRGATPHPGLDLVHPIYNVSGIGIVDGNRGDMEAAVQECSRAGKGILAMKPLGGGHLMKRRDEALRYVLDAPEVTSIALGMQSIAEIDYNLAVFSGENPSSYADLVDAQSRRLQIHDWCVACGRCIQRCQQSALYIEDGRAVVDQQKCILCGYCASVCPEFCLKVV